MKVEHRIEDGDLQYIRAALGDVLDAVGKLRQVIERIMSLQINLELHSFGVKILSLKGGLSEIGGDQNA